MASHPLKTLIFMGVTSLITLPTFGAECIANFLNLGLKEVGSEKIELKLDSPVRLTITQPSARDQKVKARFIGANSSTHEFYFVDESNGGMFFVDSTSLKMMDQNGKVITGSHQVDLSVPKQKAQDCAVESSINCVLFLKNQGLLPEESSFHYENRETLYQIFRSTDARYFEKRQAAAQRNSGAKGGSFFEKLLTSTRVESQAEVRAGILKIRGIASEIVPLDKTKPLIQHLERGYPAILDLKVKTAKQVPGKIVDRVGFEPKATAYMTSPARPSEATGGHSVVAIGVVKTGWFSKRIVVLDSGNGEVMLWNPSDLKKTSGDTATLVFPESRISR